MYNVQINTMSQIILSEVCYISTEMYCSGLLPIKATLSSDDVMYNTVVHVTCIDGYMFEDHQLRTVFHCIQGNHSSVIVTWNGTLSPCQGSYNNISIFYKKY